MPDIDIEELLDLFTIDEILEMGDMPKEEAIEILVRFGGLRLPEFLDRADDPISQSIAGEED